MTLRLRLGIAACLVLTVVTVAGFLLVRTVETSQLQQIDQQISAAAFPAARTLRIPRPSVTPPPRLVPNNTLSDIYVAIIVHGQRNVILAPTLAKGEVPRVPSIKSTIEPWSLRPVTAGSLSGPQRWRAVLIEQPGTSHQVLVAVSMTRADATAQRLKWAALAAGAIVFWFWPLPDFGLPGWVCVPSPRLRTWPMQSPLAIGHVE